MQKIKTIEELIAILDSCRTGKKIVLCHGVFDLLHIGHIRHLQEAKQLGDILVVSVTPDRYVNKGPHRPVFVEGLRAEALAALDCVDYVTINKWPMAVETIQLFRPDFYVKGPDYKEREDDPTGGIKLEEAMVKAVGGGLVFTEGLTCSSSSLINRHMAVFPGEVSDFLLALSARHSLDEVLAYLEGAQNLRVLLVGEAIIDEYQYCETIGKSGKEPILAARYLSSEKFAGGVLAVANHVADFCQQVTVLTLLGRCESQEDFIQDALDARVERIFLYLDNAPTIVKRRFVESYPLQKLFEVYVINEDDGDAEQSQALCAKLSEILPRYDVVIVTDYGHGMLGTDAVDVLCQQARFLAVNTQVNAANLGFNTISKYHRADYICVSENEIRLDARSRRRDLRDIVVEAAAKLSCGRVLITQGQQGCLCYDQQQGFFEIPAFTSRVVDRIGAGDAVFSLSALCVAQHAPMEIVGFIANAVGAQVVATVGHRESIKRIALYKHLESLLK